ncbi:hypothetical protein [Aquimarina sp. AU474]|uniref:hypothetical protein n=1 Tax=Aquimarina sp. AU474 TaxID=2108529 RepID=UPI000D69889E|nr:hypothetical protein [Aquimarina sp. AU474]
MRKTIILSLLLAFGFTSCKNSEKRNDKLEIAKQYYNILNNSDHSGIRTILGDSIVIRESESDYQESFSQKRYVEWLEWDSVFEPTYKILEIEQENEIVKTKISKIDKRIFFLHEEPMVWNEIIRFDNDKITRVERVEYEIFNVKKFLKNRNELLNWIDKNYPELNGYLYDQTESGAMKYLKAIELYKNKK